MGMDGLQRAAHGVELEDYQVLLSLVVLDTCCRLEEILFLMKFCVWCGGGGSR